MKYSCLNYLTLLLFTTPLFSQSQAGSNTVYRISELTDSFRRIDKAKSKVLYHHVFKYDKLGRPATHKLEYSYKDKLISTSTMYYRYDDKTGRLISQSGDRSKYQYFYGLDGYLSRITLHLWTGSAWQLTEETTLEYGEPQKGERNVTYTMHKLRVSGPRKDKVDRFSIIKYRLDEKKNRIIASQTVERNYLPIRSPQELKYHYDDKLNPLQQIFIERWYEIDLLNRGLSNLQKITRGNTTVGIREYQYNDQGYPTQYVLDKRRTLSYKYELINVEQSKTAEPFVGIEPSSISLFPNPATTEVTISAQNLGSGTAKVNIVDMNGRVVKSSIFSVNDKLEALIPLQGMPTGMYIVEILSSSKRERKKLLVQ